MSALSMELFTRINEDYEARQYRIRSSLKKIRRRFQRNCLYPELGQLVHLYRNLKGLLEKIDDLRSDFPKRIKDIDLENKRVIYEDITLEGDRVDQVGELIRWALPHVEQTIEEGTTLYDFVDEQITMKKVGIMPSYQNEGYLFVPDHRRSELQVHRYQTSIYTGSHDRHRMLKTRFLRTVPTDTLQPALNRIKLELIDEHRDLPNPATYTAQTQVDFPFRETLFPIVKRKLIRQLASQ